MQLEVELFDRDYLQYNLILIFCIILLTYQYNVVNISHHIISTENKKSRTTSIGYNKCRCSSFDVFGLVYDEH